MRDRLLSFGVLLTCCAAAVLMVAFGSGPAAAQEAPASVQLSGTYQLIVADPAPVLGAPPVPAEQGFLIVGARAYRLHLPPNARPRPGAHITVSGTLSGTDITASAVSGGLAVAAAPAATGTTKVLVILASWTAPDSVTQQSATRQMFTDSSGWYSQASYGALTQTGAVTPWLQIPAPADNKCYADMRNLMINAKSVALAAGYNSTNYDRTILYFPHDGAAYSDCSGYAGWAAVSGNEIWLNGYMDRRVTVHEQGHNYGLQHANTLACKDAATGNGIALAGVANCVSTEYGDSFDAMGGSGYVGSFSASEKNQLSWLGGHKAALAPGGTVTIAPMENAAAVNAAYFTASAARTYWLEYRQRAGIDAGIPATATDGVLIHLDDTAYRPKFQLLDQKPASYNNFTDATLGAGSSWMTPDGYTFTVTAVSPAGVTVRLISGSPKAPGVPTSVAVTGAGTAATITWSPPVSDGGSAITGYRVSRDGVDSGGNGPTAQLVPVSTASFTFPALRPGTTYALSVRANNAVGDGPASSGTTTMPTVAPGVPTGVATSITSTGSGTLTWSPPASDGGSTITGYRVTRNGTDCTGAGPLSTLVAAAARSHTFTCLRPGVSYTVSVQAINAVGAGQSAPATLTDQVAGAIVPVPPARIADSRTGFQIPGAVPALGRVDVQVTGRGPIPTDGVGAAVLTVTAVAPVADGYLTVWPARTSLPSTSNVNFVAGQNIPNTVIVPVSDLGAVSVFNGSPGSVQVLVDVTGYIVGGTATAAGMFVPVTPLRVADSRIGQQIAGVVAASGTVDVQLTDRAGIPADAAAVVLNVTVVTPTASGFVSAWPSGIARTTTSNVNFVAGQNIPNVVVVRLGTRVGTAGSAGTISLYNGSAGTVHLVIDACGYFRGGGPSMAGAFIAVNPTRIADSRISMQLAEALPGSGTAQLQITGQGPIPATGVAAVVLNITAVSSTGGGHLTVWPADIPKTANSNLNFQAGQIIASTVIVPVGMIDAVGVAGKISIFNGSAGTVHLVVDVAGYILRGGPEPA